MNDTKKFSDAYAGVVLAAGYGTRLQPITKKIPKPLLPFVGVPLLYLNIYRLYRLGLGKVIINGHYLWQQVKESMDSCPIPMEKRFSLEEHLLGTGGAYGPMDHLREGKSLISINGDVISDFTLSNLIKKHEQNKAHASMALLPHTHAGEIHIWCEKSGLVVGIGKEQPTAEAVPYGFACAQILSDRFLCNIEKNKPESLIYYYRKALAKGEIIVGHVEPCFWFDLGTPESYWEAHKRFLDDISVNLGELHEDRIGVFSFSRNYLRAEYQFIPKPKKGAHPSRVLGPSLLSLNITAHSKARLGPYLVATGEAAVDADAMVQESVVSGKCRVPSGQKLKNFLLFDEHSLALKISS